MSRHHSPCHQSLPSARKETLLGARRNNPSSSQATSFPLQLGLWLLAPSSLCPKSSATVSNPPLLRRPLRRALSRNPTISPLTPRSPAAQNGMAHLPTAMLRAIPPSPPRRNLP